MPPADAAAAEIFCRFSMTPDAIIAAIAAEAFQLLLIATRPHAAAAADELMLMRSNATLPQTMSCH